MPTQLNYSFITPPNAGYLTAGQTAALEFLVSNSGDAVTLNSLAFTFPYGSAGSDLCASVSDASATTLPGDKWTAETDSSGDFVLTPPGGSISVDSNGGFTFTLSIPVNSEPGVLNLHHDPTQPVQSFIITESTDAGIGSWSPPPLSKFPAEFQFSDLIATPSPVQQGAPIELSWTGTPGASYTINWPDDEFITYSDGPAPITQSDTSFPPLGSGQTLAAGASQLASFSVSAEYSSGGQTLSAGPVTVSVGVNLDAPTIASFTAIWQGPGLELKWVTENAASSGVSIPAITSEALIASGSFAFTPSSAQPLPSSITLIATNQAGQTASQTLVRVPLRVPVGPSPACVAVSPDGTRVFVANHEDSTLTVLDAKTLLPVNPSPLPMANGPCSVAVSPNGTLVFIADREAGALQVWKVGTLQEILGSPVDVEGNTPVAVAVSPDGTRVFVADEDGTLTVVDVKTLETSIVPPVPGAQGPASVAVSPDGTGIFLANRGSNNLTVLDAGTLQPIPGSPVSVGNQPGSVAVSPDGTRFFVANQSDGTLTVLDAGTLQPIPGSPFSVGSFPASVVLSSDSASVFVANEGDNDLMVLDAQTLQPIDGSPFSVGNSPVSVAMSPDGASVFVANQGDNSLTVFTPEFVPADPSSPPDAVPGASRGHRARAAGQSHH